MGIFSNLSKIFRDPPEPEPAPAPAAVFDKAMEPAVEKSVSTSSGDGWALGWAGFWPAQTGIQVNHYSALQSAACWACCNALSSDISRLPLRLHRELPEGGFKVEKGHELFEVFRRPNYYQSGIDMIAYAVTSLVLRGNAYILVLRNGDGTVRTLLPINPDRVTIMQTEGRPAVFYGVTHHSFADQIVVPSEDMIHVKMITFGDGLRGISPIMASQDVISLSLAAQQYAAVAFRQGGRPSGILKTDAVLSPEAAQRLSQAWESSYGNVQNSGKTAVLQDGMDFAPISISPEDSQLLESRKYSVQEIARVFGVPNHRIGDLSESHFNTLAQQTQSYISNSLLPIARRFEEEFEDKLLSRTERKSLSIRFDFESMLRVADIKDRGEWYQIMLLNGVFSIDEVRIMEKMAPVGLTDHRVPLNQGNASNPAEKPNVGTPDQIEPPKKD